MTADVWYCRKCGFAHHTQPAEAIEAMRMCCTCLTPVVQLKPKRVSNGVIEAALQDLTALRKRGRRGE